MRPSKLERITRAIRLNPGITQKELAEDLGLKFSTINEYVIKMKGTGLLTVIQKGKKKHLYLFDEQSSEKNGYRDLDNQ
jgi:predicted transcriptional regulator